MIFPDADRPVNAKSAAGRPGLLPGGPLGNLGGALGAELGGQPIRRRLHGFGAALQHLVGHPPDRPGDAERADHVAGEIIDRHRDAADFRVELAVVEGDRAAPDLGDFAQQYRRLGDRLDRHGLCGNGRWRV